MASPSNVIIVDVSSKITTAEIQTALDAALALQPAHLEVVHCDLYDINMRGQRVSSAIIGLSPKASPSSAASRVLSATGPVTLDDEVIFVNTAGGAVVAELPTALLATGRFFFFKFIEDTSTCDIDPDGTEQIDAGGAGTPYNLATIQDSVTLYSDGLAWHVI